MNRLAIFEFVDLLVLAVLPLIGFIATVVSLLGVGVVPLHAAASVLILAITALFMRIRFDVQYARVRDFVISW